MREIKFRAVFDGKIVEYVKWENCNWMYSEDQKTWYFERKHAHTYLTSFTGLLDKLGRDIYEGDFVEFEPVDKDYRDLRVGKCVYDAPSFLMKTDFGNIRWWPQGSQVIGNIYENPELLKN